MASEASSSDNQPFHYQYTTLPLPTKTLLDNIKYLLFEGCSIQGVMQRLSLFDVHESDIQKAAEIYNIAPLSDRDK
jgi:hypothetical protein